MSATPLEVFDCPLDGVRLVEASAGTGKTWNICALVLRLMLERGLPLSQILVVTFTKAAAAELRERIRARVVETLAHARDLGAIDSASMDRANGGTAADAGDPFVPTLWRRLRERADFDAAALVARLEQALQTFDEAAIFTIHGFCHRAIGDLPFVSGAALAVEPLADDRELCLQVAQDFWRRRVAAPDAPAPLAAHLLARRDSPEAWADLLKRRLGKPLARLEWPDLSAAAAGAPTAEDVAAAHAEVRTRWPRERADVLPCVLDAVARGDLNRNSYKEAAIGEAGVAWDRLSGASDPLLEHEALRRDELAQRLDLLRRCVLERRTLKGRTAPVHPFFDLAERLVAALEAQRDALDAERLRLLRDLLEEGPPALRRALRERRAVSFDEMLHDLHARLHGPSGGALVSALRERFAAALIDEFQDTDPLQLDVFETIYRSGGGPLFFVGDPKQAIYGFRNADLHSYLQARERADATYTLVDNQRSVPALLDALNALFGANPRAFMLPGVDYHPVRAGTRTRPRLDDRSVPRPALQLWRLPVGADGRALDKTTARAAAAQACAEEIARLLEAAGRDELRLDGRPLRADDIAVLVGTHRQGATMRRALAAAGVGAVELSQRSVFASPQARDLEQVLLAVTEPAAVPRLRAALATELMGHDATAIDALAADESRLSGWTASFLDLRDAWHRRGVAVMLRQWMALGGVVERLLARDDGERAMTNLLHLGELLQQAAQEHRSPPALLHWYRAQCADPRADEATQWRLESDRHLVPILTIHRSKGLEFPIVFCPFLWERRGARRRNGDGVEVHDEDGQLVVDFRTPADDAGLKARLALEAAAEDVRLAYVALTRAVHRCHVVVGDCAVRDSTREGRRGVLPWLAAGGGRDPRGWLDEPADSPAIDAAWQALERSAPGAIALEPLPVGTGRTVPAQGLPAAAIAARSLPRPVPAPWTVASFSALAAGLRAREARADHDQRVDAGRDAKAPAAPADADDILAFPRGAGAGDCLHVLFEHARFDDPSTWPPAIETALSRHPPGGAGEPRRFARMLERLLGDVTTTPLAPGLRLADVSRGRRLVELEFALPAPAVGAGALARAVAELGGVPPDLGHGTLRGYLRGFIDLVFEHGGRYHVVDWKSNHLGDAAPAYGRRALDDAMSEHGYRLQALLYAVAVHRLLRARRPDYDPARHFGGVMFLFVRGVRPGWVQADGTPAGVWRLDVDAGQLERWSALFDPCGVAA